MGRGGYSGGDDYGGGYIRIRDRLRFPPEYVEGHAAGFIMDTRLDEEKKIDPLEACVLECNSYRFTALIRGEDFSLLPNAHIQVKPVVNFHLHDLIGQEGWVLCVRQRAYTMRPRVTLYNDGRTAYFSFKLKCSKAPMYKKLADVIADLETAEWYVKVAQAQHNTPSNILERRPHMRDELELLQLFNKRRYDALYEYLHRPTVPQQPLPDNVLRIVDRLKRKEPSEQETTELLRRVEALTG